MSLVKFAAIFVAAATASQLSVERLYRQAVFAQSFGETPDTFPIPDSLPDGTTLKLDGSTSMRFTNETLENRFETQFPNVDVELDASRTDEAFEALIKGEIDVLATGRPLTDAEKAQGVVEVPLEQREKLAIVLGPDNGFEGDLTFEQFAQIFRGEITNWSEVGGPDNPIRLVDRPDYSDTRRALSTYAVFEGKPFETGTTADPATDDETDTVVKALGTDGIGYAVVSQVAERDDVRIIPMHQTLPDDPRYPYSQYRAFVYKEEAGPAALAFMGFATTAPGQEVFASDPVASDAPSTTDTSAATDAPAAADAPSATDAPAAVDAPSATDVPAAADAPAATDASPSVASAPTAAAGKGGFPLWLLPLLAIPLLGALLWWLLKGGSGGGAAGAPAAAAPVPLQPRMVLTPRDCRNAYAYWEIPKEHLADIKRQGGETMMVRIYDVTGRSKNTPLPSPVAEFPCLESNPDLHLPIAVDDRSYCAEIGYLTKDNQWLSIVKSDPVRVPVCPAPSTVSSPAISIPKTNVNRPTGAAVLGGATLAGAAALGATKLTKAKAKTPVDTGRMVLTPRNAQDVYAYWEIPRERLADAKLQGGETLVAKLYDVTDRPANAVLPPPTAQLECTETDTDAHFAITSDRDLDRDYVAEIGYQTASGDWLPLAQSNSVRVPAALTVQQEDAGTGTKIPSDAVLGGAVAAAAMAAGVASSNQKDSTPPAAQSRDQSRIVMTPQTSQKAYVYWEVPETAKSALKVEGGKDYQLRIHDVTNIELDQQSPNSTLTYDLLETDCDRTVPLPSAESDYVAEIGYQTASDDWLPLTRSTSIKPAMGLTNNTLETNGLSIPETDSSTTGIGMATKIAAAGGLAAAALKSQPSAPKAAEPESTDVSEINSSSQGITQTVKVHSRNNAVMFDEGQLHHIEHDVASTHQLVPGVYVLRLRDGVFNYDADDNHPGEPFVLLWIHGGTVINQKTGVAVSSTWTTLNGYDDTLMLDVREPATLCAFFVDTYPDDNSGEVTLSVIKQ